MQSEWNSLSSNKIWRLVYLPEHRPILKNRWVFKEKSVVDGKISRFKAHWIVKGSLQREGTDYNKTY